MRPSTKEAVINEIESILRLPLTQTSAGGTPVAASLDRIMNSVLGEGSATRYPNKYRRIQALIEALGGNYDPGVYPKSSPDYRVGDTSEAVDIYGRSEQGNGEIGGGNITREGLDKVLDLLLAGGYGATTPGPTKDATAPISAPDIQDDNRLVRLAKVASRPGAGAYREMVREAYGGRCCISGADEVLALEAAHIYPYMGTHSDRLDNSLLLRVDIHRLFDARHIAVDERSLGVVISDRLRGTVYETFEGKVVTLPRSVEAELRAALEAHRLRSQL